MLLLVFIGSALALPVAGDAGVPAGPGGGVQSSEIATWMNRAGGEKVKARRSSGSGPPWGARSALRQCCYSPSPETKNPSSPEGLRGSVLSGGRGWNPRPRAWEAPALPADLPP